MGVIHLIDPKRGRATVRRIWTVCGEARSSRIVSRDVRDVTCPNCRKAPMPPIHLADDPSGGTAGELTMCGKLRSRIQSITNSLEYATCKLCVTAVKERKAK